MNRSGKPLPADVDERLQRLAGKLAADPRVDAVWLFGSRARGEADALSDVDIALLAHGRPSAAELDRFRQEWLLAAAAELDSDEVSLLVLNSAPVALRHGALNDARLLWSRRPELAADFEAWTLKEYFDFKPRLDDYDRALFAQAAAGAAPMTVDPQILAARIARIRENLKLLDRIGQMPLERFRASPIEQHATEWELLVTIEACLDIAHHVVAREGLRRPADHRDLFKILGEARIIPVELASRLEKMAGFRNLLVHAYLAVDPGEVFRAATGDLADVEAFVRAVVARFGPTPE